MTNKVEQRNFNGAWNDSHEESGRKWHGSIRKEIKDDEAVSMAKNVKEAYVSGCLKYSAMVILFMESRIQV